MVALHRIETYGRMTNVSNGLEAVADEPKLSPSPDGPDRSSVPCAPDAKAGLPNTTDGTSGPSVSVKSETPEVAASRVSSGQESNLMTKTDNATAKAVRQPVLIYRKPFDGTVTARTRWSSNGCFSADKSLYRKLPDNGQVSQDLTRQTHGAPVTAGPVLSSVDTHLHNSWGLLLNTSKEKITQLLEADDYLHILIAALITYRRRALDILLRASTAIKRAVVKVAIAGLLTAGVMPVALLPATVPLRSPGSVLKAAAERKNNMVVKMPIENAGFVNGKTVLAVVTDQADYEHTMEVYNARLAARGTPQEKEAQRAWDRLSAQSAMRSH